MVEVTLIPEISSKCRIARFHPATYSALRPVGGSSRKNSPTLMDFRISFLLFDNESSPRQKVIENIRELVNTTLESMEKNTSL